MPSTTSLTVKLAADTRPLMAQIVAQFTLLLHDRLTDDGFQRTDERIVQHIGSGVTVAVNPDGYRISYYCPEGLSGDGRIDLPLSTPTGEVAYVARVLHRAEPA